MSLSFCAIYCTLSSFQSAFRFPPVVIFSAAGKAVLRGGWRLRFRLDLVLAGSQDRLDVLVGGLRRILKCPPASIFQTLRCVFVCQLQQAQAGLVALLLYTVTAQDWPLLLLQYSRRSLQPNAQNAHRSTGYTSGAPGAYVPEPCCTG